jgi:aryl-alcohol dehydrogenase-like predicted oxidoreductase
MRYTILGNSGLRVSELCLGTMTFGEAWGWGVPETVCADILDAFAEAGGNFVDTANTYTGGSAEEFLGRLLIGRRHRFVLGTKYNGMTRPGDVNSAGNHRKNLVASLEASLRRLRTDHVDVLWVHARDTWTPVEEVMRALDDQVRAGKVLQVGVSDWPAWEIAQADTFARLRGWSPFVGVQLRYNLLDRTAERELLPMARGLGIPALAWGPLAEGQLTGKYRNGGSRRGRLDVYDWSTWDERTTHRAERIVHEVVRIAGEGGWQPAQVALAWLRGRPGTVVPIIGCTSRSQLERNIEALEVRLDPAQVSRLDSVSQPDLGFPHDFLRLDSIKQVVYGDRWELVEDSRPAARHAADDPW